MTNLPRGISLKGNKYVAQCTRNGKRVQRVANTLPEAISILASLRDTTDTPDTQMRPKAVTLDHCWRELLTSTDWGRGKSSSVNLSYVNNLTQLIGHMCVNDITTSVLDTVVVQLRKQGNSPATINRKLCAINKALGWALERQDLSGYYPSSTVKIPYQREPQGRTMVFSDDDIATMCAIMVDHGYHDQAKSVLVLVDTGLRLGELWAIRQSSVNLTSRLLTVRKSKTDQQRTIPLTTRVVKLLADCSWLDGTDNQWLYTAWTVARNAMGQDNNPEWVPHCLRHTCATRLTANGVSLAVVKQWLGHSSTATTMRYAHADTAALMSAVRTLDLV